MSDTVNLKKAMITKKGGDVTEHVTEKAAVEKAAIEKPAEQPKAQK